MVPKIPEDITFQITVGWLTLSPRPCKQDLRITVCVNDVSKITCSGNSSKDGSMVTWNHPFLFTASPSSAIRIAIWTLPEELTFEWDKEPVGDQIVTDVVNLIQSGNEWKCNVPGVSSGPATLSTLSIRCNASDVIASDGHNCLSALRTYSFKLYKFGQQLKNMSFVLTQIELDQSRLDLCSSSHKDYGSILNDLACSFQFCYNRKGSVSDLNRAFEISQARLELCSVGHSQHVDALGTHAMISWNYYCIQKNKEDLRRLLELQERWLALCPPGHAKHTKALGVLALFLWEQYQIQGTVASLNRAIEMAEKRIAINLKGHPDHGVAIAGLAVYLGAQYNRQHNLNDLNRAIDFQEEDLKLRPSIHPEHGVILLNLAVSLQKRYHRTKDHSDLIRAVKLLQDSLNACPAQHPHFAIFVKELVAVILFSIKSLKGHHSLTQSVPSLDEAFRIYEVLKSYGPAVSLDLLQAIQAWVKNAGKYGHSSILKAYQTLFNTLDHFTSLKSSLDSRHEIMQTRVAELANTAFSHAVKQGKLQKAIELLEQGRGILWNQLARFDISLAALEGQGNPARELGQKFARLSADLRNHAQRGGGNTDSYWRVKEKWQSVVDDIRSLDGFSRFLLPPRFDDLQQAAEYGPVIVVNASQRSCDALIISRTRPPVRVSLPCSFDDVDQLCSQLLELTQDAHAYGTNRESYVKQMLRDLWSSVVEPIASALQNDIQLPAGARIWWCPTSKFTTLPFHAAGPHRKAQKNLFDMYISSYAPSLSTLIRTCDRIRSQRAARDAVGAGNTVSFAAVGQGRPSPDTKLGELPEVAHELRRIRDETGMPPEVAFETVAGDAATIDGAVRAFHAHRWVHVACHGSQHASRPFDSWFAMGDGTLTLMRILQARYARSEFAFLSACHTAVGDASTPDEVLHLAAGMQFAGFNGVIGTLWRVDDAVAHQVVTRFYRAMFGRPVVGFEHAAEALNAAVVETAGEVSLEKRIVFVHIGI